MSKKGSVLRLQCDQHEFMQGWYLPVTNAHYGVAGADGTFEIKDVPAGKHKVVAWHPIAGQVEADVDVKDGEPSKPISRLNKSLSIEAEHFFKGN